MFPNLIQLTSGRPLAPDGSLHVFIDDVRVSQRESRSPRVERLILECWILIAIKHVVIIWAVHHYPVPFHQLWVNFPTWLLGVLATAIYFWQVRRP